MHAHTTTQHDMKHKLQVLFKLTLYNNIGAGPQEANPGLARILISVLYFFSEVFCRYIFLQY